MRMSLTLSLIVIVGTNAGFGQGVDLAAKYPAQLDHTPVQIGYVWNCAPRDVWRLASFSYELEGQVSLQLGPSEVVFGKHGTTVLWAVILPDRAGKLDAPASGGSDTITHVWLRFHPGQLGRLFPAATVKGPGAPEKRRLAKRICAWKIRGSWQNGGLPMVPEKDAVVIDLDTAKRVRRFFSIDEAAGRAKYYSDFERNALPPARNIDSTQALEIFDGAWDAFDREYAMFAIKPGVDWKALRDTYRPQAAKAKTYFDVAAIVSEMLEHLEDLHVWVRFGGEMIPGYSRPRQLNGFWPALDHKIANFTNISQGFAWGRMPDGIGYVNIYRLGSGGLPKAFDAVLEKLADTWGLVIDLRFNGGGDVLLAREVAGRFLQKKCVYSYSQYRSDAAHDDLGKKFKRECEPRGPWRYESSVVVLIGQQTMSSAESFALMLAQAPQVTTMGDRTAGSSANPRILALPGKISVNLPRWLDLKADGKPLDNVGVVPDIEISVPPGVFDENSDPILDAALKNLRNQPPEDRQSGKRK